MRERSKDTKQLIVNRSIEPNTDYECREPFDELKGTRLSAMESKATLTNRKVLLVPKAKSLVIKNTKKSVVENPKCQTLCIYEQALPKATLLACTDASDAMEWQSTTTDWFGMHTGHWPSGTLLRDLAKGSVGLLMINKPPAPKPKMSAIPMAITQKKSELLKSVQARNAALHRAKTRKEIRQRNPNSNSTGNMTDTKDNVPNLYNNMASKTMKRQKRRKRRKARNLMKADDTTDAPRTRKLILHENSVHQYQVPKEDTTKQSCGCRYIDRKKM